MWAECVVSLGTQWRSFVASLQNCDLNLTLGRFPKGGSGTTKGRLQSVVLGSNLQWSLMARRPSSCLFGRSPLWDKGMCTSAKEKHPVQCPYVMC